MVDYALWLRNMPNKWKWMPFTDVNDIQTDSTELFPEIFKFLAFHAQLEDKRGKIMFIFTWKRLAAALFLRERNFLDMYVFNSVERISKSFWWDVCFQLHNIFERLFIQSFQKTRSNQYQIFWMTSLIIYCDETFVTKLSTIVKDTFNLLIPYFCNCKSIVVAKHKS